MGRTVIRVENISKQYRLGKIGTGTFSHDLNRWWHAIRGKEDPYLKVGELNDRTIRGKSEYVWALNDVSFDIEEGDVVGIIGRNGAGKSTLLKILSRTTLPSSGNIKIKGRIASLLEVGTGFHPELTGRENIFLNGAILGMTRREVREKFDEIVDFSGVERYIDTPVKRYSSGMYVRLAFGVAAHLEPDILIVDEVLAVGDVDFQKKAIRKMGEVSKGEGRTVLFVSHNMGNVRSICSKAIILKKGQKQLEGNVDTLVSSYLNDGIENISHVKIEDRTDRSGSGKVRICNVRIIDNQTQMEIKQIISGMSIRFSIEYKVIHAVTPLGLLEIGIAFYDSNNRFVTVLNNVMANRPLYWVDTEGLATCDINKFPLMSGAYYARVMIKVNGEICDLVENALTVFVNEGDFYNSGKANALGRQGVYIEQYWND